MPTFKELYKADNLILSPEPELIELISERMGEETLKKETKKVPFIKKIPLYKTASAAAALAILITGVIILPLLLNNGQFLNDNSPEIYTADIAETRGFSAADENTDYAGDGVFPEEAAQETKTAFGETIIFDNGGNLETGNGETGYAAGFIAEAENYFYTEEFPENEIAGIMFIAENDLPETEATVTTSIPEITVEEETAAKAEKFARTAAVEPIVHADTTAVADEITPYVSAAVAETPEPNIPDNSYNNNAYRQYAGFTNWPETGYWKSYIISDKSPEFINQAGNDFGEEYEEEEEYEEGFDDMSPDYGAGGGADNNYDDDAGEDANDYDDDVSEVENDYDYDTAEEETDNEYKEENLPSGPAIPYFNRFEDFSKIFMSAPHSAVSVIYNNGINTSAKKDLKEKNTIPFYSLLSSCLKKQMKTGTAAGFYVKFTVRTDKREIYFKINSSDLMEVTLSDYSGAYILTLDKGTFNRIWNLAESY